jgi:hypothetical protein
VNAVNFVARLAVQIAIALAMVGAAFGQTTDAETKAILQRALAYQFQFRVGQMDVVPEYVAMLEEATKADPENAELWNAMGVAYLAQAARAMMPGGRPADALPAIQKGPAALERALQLNPKHAEALATHGGVQAFMGLYQQGPAGAAKGVDQMNRAIELAPTSRRVRLQRAFSGINLPDALRNRANEAEDLDFLIALANGTRPGDYLRLMQGDLHAEGGASDLARARRSLLASGVRGWLASGDRFHTGAHWRVVRPTPRSGVPRSSSNRCRGSHARVAERRRLRSRNPPRLASGGR